MPYHAPAFPPRIATWRAISPLGSIANNASDANNDIDFVDIESYSTTGLLMAKSGTVTKRLDAPWAAGTGNGGLFSGNKANSTTYHCFQIRKRSDKSIDYGFDTSLVAANIPAGYTAYRRVGSILTDGSGNILAFSQVGDYFTWATVQSDYQSTSPPTTNTLQKVTVPIGRSFLWIGRNTVQASVANQLFNVASGLLSSADSHNRASTYVTGVNIRAPAQCPTDTLSRVLISASTADNWTAGGCSINTFGYIDDRRD